MAKVIPLSVADGVAAVIYVKQHAAELRRHRRIGSASSDSPPAVRSPPEPPFTPRPKAHPPFSPPIYGSASMFKDCPVPADAPPLFVAAATDDNLGLAPDSVALYQKWVDAHKSAELHMYAKGGHGFGARKHNIPTDTWIDRLADWLQLEGFLK